MRTSDTPAPTAQGRPCVVALIPARSGSKGIPGKNLADLGGRPLLAWTIEAALACPLIDRVIVSTDGEDIAREAERFGAEAPFLRPADISGDGALIGAVERHAREELVRGGYRPAVMAILYPTSPFRPPGLLETLVRLNLDGHASVTTVRRMPHTPLAFLPDTAPCRFTGTPPGVPLFRGYGLYDGTSCDPASRGCLYHEIDDPLALLDIDSPRDLLLAREAVRAGLAAGYVPGAPR